MSPLRIRFNGLSPLGVLISVSPVKQNNPLFEASPPKMPPQIPLPPLVLCVEVEVPLPPMAEIAPRFVPSRPIDVFQRLIAGCCAASCAAAPSEMFVPAMFEMFP